ncbi:MAG: AI-2E family transporter [Bacteroidetes bacterium HGW-Bacteroidetes-1]|jgi:predicted PurR-regulated permease PerM|nr:MAG: AI-2E family transporter [Bacteroidetes bacterium HGW-Bacteroidetes-1]
MDKVFRLPFYAKASIILVGMFVFIWMMYIASGIIVPLIFAFIIAVVLYPIVAWFEKKKVNRVLSIIFTLIVAFLALAGLGFLMYSQFSRLSMSSNELIEKFTDVYNEAMAWASGYFEIKPEQIIDYISKAKAEFFKNSGDAIGQTLMSVGNGLVVLFVIPVYVFLILFYKPLLLDFIHQIFGTDHKITVSEIVNQTKTVIQKYLTGLIIEIIIIAVLNTTGLLILGIEYALLLGIIGALLNVIPYIGGIVAVALPMIIALITKDSPMYALYVLGIYYTIQLIDNNYIVPKIVASKVKVNALVSIVVIFAFGALWGIPGMFLSIPITAIFKVICDHIESLKPVGFLLGDTMPVIGIFKIKTLLDGDKKINHSRKTPKPQSGS